MDKRKWNRDEKIGSKIWPSENYDFAFYCCRAFYFACIATVSIETNTLRDIHAMGSYIFVEENSLRIVIFLSSNPLEKSHFSFAQWLVFNAKLLVKILWKTKMKKKTKKNVQKKKNLKSTQKTFLHLTRSVTRVFGAFLRTDALA